ncbi:MAG: hypothetical protein PUC11_00535 [Elusimicrobia bacterium]|nr:hypothetical protein [Elusimicrobiota bacterium]
MRIKIKNPHTAAHNQTLFMTGIFSLLIVAGVATAAYCAGGLLAAWNALGDTINTMCEDDLRCRLGFAFLFKLCPFLIPGIFVLTLWEKRTKFRSPLPGTYFTHITFGKDGVLLEKPNPAQNVFFPYGETALDLSVTAHQISTKNGGRITAVSNVKFTFTQQGGNCKAVELLPPRKVIPFLCKILDARLRYAQFSYKVTPLRPSYQETADALHKKLDKYCQTGFLSEFDSPLTRIILLLAGLVFTGIGTALSVFLFLNSQTAKDFFLFIPLGLFLIPIGLYFTIGAVKDIYRERKSRRK